MRADAFNPEMVEEEVVVVMALAEDELIFQRSCLFLLAVAAQLWVLEEVFHYLFLCYLQEQQELGERIERDIALLPMRPTVLWPREAGFQETSLH